MDLADLLAAIGSKAVPAAAPDWAVAVIPTEDEASDLAVRDESSGWSGFIRYTNAKGEYSERRIICRAIEGYGRAETVSAWCCEKRAPKRFRIDRIAELVDLQTGELLDPAQHFEQLRLFGVMRIEDRALSDFALALVFMARCDGNFHPLEAESVDQAIERYVVRFGGDDRLVERVQKNAATIAPDGEDFVNALRRLGQHPERKQLIRLLLQSIGDVNAADGLFHCEEVEWSRLVEDALQEMVVSR